MIWIPIALTAGVTGLLFASSTKVRGAPFARDQAKGGDEVTIPIQGDQSGHSSLPGFPINALFHSTGGISFPVPAKDVTALILKVNTGDGETVSGSVVSVLAFGPQPRAGVPWVPQRVDLDTPIGPIQINRGLISSVERPGLDRSQARSGDKVQVPMQVVNGVPSIPGFPVGTLPVYFAVVALILKVESVDKDTVSGPVVGILTLGQLPGPYKHVDLDTPIGPIRIQRSLINSVERHIT